MNLEVFPDQLHPADDFPGTVDPEIQAMADRGELNTDWTADQLLTFLLADMDQVAETAVKFMAKLPDDAKVLFKLSFCTRFTSAHDKLQDLKTYLHKAATGEVAPSLREKIADFGNNHIVEEPRSGT